MKSFSLRLEAFIFILSFAVLDPVLSIRAAPLTSDPCDIPAATDLWVGFDQKPARGNFTDVIQNRSKRRLALLDILKRCPQGPADLAARDLLFQYFSREQDFIDTVGYGDWSSDEMKAAVADGDVFGSRTREALQEELRKVADPTRDASRMAVIARIGDAETLARFGPAIEPYIRSLLSGNVYIDQRRALEAYGRWMLPTEKRFTADEKDSFRELILGKLPKPALLIHGGAWILADASLKALGNASDTVSEAAVRQWREKFVNLGNTPSDGLAVTAQRSLDSIRKNRGRAVEK